MDESAVASDGQAGMARLVSCVDLAGRRQSMIVLAYRGRLGMVSPAGALAVLSCAEVHQLRAALADAAQTTTTGVGGSR